MEAYLNDFSLTDNPERVDLKVVHQLLATSYWASERSLETIAQSCRNSICFSLYHKERQIGFARIVTDHATFAWLADVIIDQAYRGQGLGKWLVAKVLEHPAVQVVGKVTLNTRDAHGLYERFGFEKTEMMRAVAPFAI